MWVNSAYGGSTSPTLTWTGGGRTNLPIATTWARVDEEVKRIFETILGFTKLEVALLLEGNMTEGQPTTYYYFSRQLSKIIGEYQ